MFSITSKLQYSASLEQDMATHSSILAGKIPRTEMPSRGQSMGSQSRTRLSSHTIEHAHVVFPIQHPESHIRLQSLGAVG